MTDALEQALGDFLQRERLPRSYLDGVRRHFAPLAAAVAERAEARPGPLLLGIQGGQGTGKSTLARVLAVLLQRTRGLTVAELSIDDFYLTRAEREQLARDVHPLLATRGVPGTHDVGLALATLERLRRLAPGEELLLPRFDKASDDRCPVERWARIGGPVDVVILEGWFVGAPPLAAAEEEAPLNALEAEEDADGRWRRYVRARLEGVYQDLFAQIDYLVVLQAPSFECIYRWRGLQEEKLAALSDGPAVMDEARLARFIQHYERLTRHCLATLPARADRLFRLDENHQVRGAS